MPSRRGPRILAGLAAGALCLYLLVVLALHAGQRRLLFMPDPSRPDLGPARSLGARAETLRTTDGLALLAWYLPPPAGRPVILYLHGNGGNLANRIPRLLAFAKAGWGVLMPEYRGYGGNPGEPSAEGFDLDARAAAAFLDTAGIPPARRVLYGESIGTGVAVRLGAEHPIGALILESPYTSITAIARRRFPFVPVGLLLRDPFDALSRIDQVRAPLLVLQGTRDSIVPPDLGRALFDAAPEPKQLWVAPLAGHNDLMQHGAFPVIAGFVGRLNP